MRHDTDYVDSEGKLRCVDCDKWLEPGYYDIDQHCAQMAMDEAMK